MKKFPKVLYVAVEGDSGEEWFASAENIEAHATVHGNKVAVYELKETLVAGLVLEVKRAGKTAGAVKE